MNLNNGNNIFDANIRHLIAKYPSFKTDILDKYTPSNKLVVTESAEGALTARFDNIWIHSSRSPEKEARKLIRSGIKKKSGLCLVYGFGLGYHIEALMDAFPEIQLLIVEPEPGLLLQAMQFKDFTKIIDSDKTGFLLKVQQESLPSVLNRFNTINIQIIKLRSLYEKNADYYEALDKEIKTFIRKKQTNINTLNRFGRIWTRNLFRNMEVFCEAGNIGDWYGKFREIPALVIAAGPSLDVIVPFLNEIRNRCVLICVDTALRAVITEGINPDFIVVVDPQYLNTRHLDNLLCSEQLSESVLISESSTHPAVFRTNRLPVYFFRSVFPLGKLIEKHTRNFAELGAGGSVATTAWDLARRLGCPEIYTAGLDLGFPDNKTHCRISLASFLTQMKTCRTLSVEGINFAGIYNADPFKEPNNSGTETITDHRLIIYKWWFEGQLKTNQTDGFYNLSESGIRINGMKYHEAGKMLELPELRDSVESIKKQVIQNRPETTSDMKNNLGPLLVAIQTECNRLERICTSALDILNRMKDKDNEHFFREGIERLAEFDKKISESPSKDLTGFIIQPVLNEIINEEKSMLENSENLYSSILDAGIYYRTQVQHVLERFFMRS